MNSFIKTTAFLVLVVIVAALVMFQKDSPNRNRAKSELILFCDNDYCTTAAGAFWAKQDSLDSARFFGTATDEALPPNEGA